MERGKCGFDSSGKGAILPLNMERGQHKGVAKNWEKLQVILFEVDCAILYTNLHVLSVHKLNKLGKFW